MELKQLSIGYAGGKKGTIFHNISAHIAQGVLIALFGRNGIGKSTLLKTMAGVQPPTAGSITLYGDDLRKYKPNQLAKQIAFVPSQPLRTPGLSVTDMVGIGRYRYTNWIGSERKIDKEVINNALTATSLNHLAYRDSATLSDGELQRASIARALAQETPFIFLDEPTAFLDMGNKYKTIYLLKELTQTARKGIVFSTHDLTLALQLCDFLWIMEDNGFHAAPPGHLIQTGILNALFSTHNLIFDPEILTYRKIE